MVSLKVLVKPIRAMTVKVSPLGPGARRMSNPAGLQPRPGTTMPHRMFTTFGATDTSVRLPGAGGGVVHGPAVMAGAIGENADRLPAASLARTR